MVKLNKGFCSFHEKECIILKEKYINKKTLDERLEVLCDGRYTHEPIPAIIYQSEMQWLIEEIIRQERRLSALKKRLNEIRSK